MSPSTLILLVLAITPSCGAGGPIPPDRGNYGRSNRGNPYESLTAILRFRKTRTAATGGAGRRAAGGHSRPPTSAPSPGPVPASYLALRCDPAWRGPAEYPRRPRRVARSDVSPPGLGPPRREVTPGTMEAAINLKIAVNIAGARFVSRGPVPDSYLLTGPLETFTPDLVSCPAYNKTGGP